MSVGIAPSARSVRLTTRAHPILWMIAQRVLMGIGTLFVVSIVTFVATQVLPGNAAYAVLGHSAGRSQIAALERQLGLDRSVVAQYWSWLSGLVQGHFGESLTANVSVWSLVGPRIVNSAALVVAAGFVGTLVGVASGLLAAVKRDKPIDHVMCVIALGAAALPEFVVAVALIFLLATNVLHILPAVSPIPPGQEPWQQLKLLVLPTLTLVIVTAPYIFRMMRAATIEALESDYVELARLKGLSAWAVILRHAVPNAVAPTIQAIGLCLLYLAGGIVVVEVVFAYPGIGQGLYSAVLDKDIPTIQFTVVLLGAFYVLTNIATDVISVVATPRRRVAR